MIIINHLHLPPPPLNKPHQNSKQTNNGYMLKEYILRYNISCSNCWTLKKKSDLFFFPRKLTIIQTNDHYFVEKKSGLAASFFRLFHLYFVFLVMFSLCPFLVHLRGYQIRFLQMEMFVHYKTNQLDLLLLFFFILLPTLSCTLSIHLNNHFGESR